MPFSSKTCFLTALSAAVLFSFCKNSTPKPANDVTRIGVNEIEATRTAANPLLKLKTPAETGIDFQNTILESDEDNFTTNPNKYNGGGMAIADVDNDGLPDVYFISTNGQNRLYKNLGGLKFSDITERAGLKGTDGFETAVTAADVNADGWLDLYVCRAGTVAGDVRRNLLFINNHDLTFSEKAREFGLDDASASTGANFFDADGDGDLDVYVLNYPSSADYSNKFETGVLNGRDQLVIPPKQPGDSDHFYRNDGGKFTEISQKAGIWNQAYGLSVSVSDLDLDGKPDVYVGNDFIHPDFFYKNLGGCTFQNRLSAAFRHTSRHTMGTDLTDFDNDGLVDLYGVDMLPMNNSRQKREMTTMTQTLYKTTIDDGYYEPVVRNVLQRNLGNGTFSDVGCQAGVFMTEWGWSGLLFDMDNDGRRDLAVTNGYRRDINDRDYFEFDFPDLQKRIGKMPPKEYFKGIENFLKLIPTYKPRNCYFRNDGGLKFSDAGGDWLTVPASWSCGAAWADLDGDGDLDYVVNNLEEPSFVYENLSRQRDAGGSHFLQIKLSGPPSNPFGVGASAMISFGDEKQYLEINPTRGIFSSVEHLLHFGLGKNTTVEKLTVRWPDGKTQTFQNLPADQRLVVKYAEAKGPVVAHLSTPNPAEIGRFFTETTAKSGISWVHTENKFNDFDAWPFSFFRETDLGPLLATGDANGDGLDDFFIGNGFDAAAGLFIQKRDGSFSPSNQPLFEQEKIYEDHGAAFFDADGDGDLDLFVVSGGAEATNPVAWQNRLFLNDGKGSLAKSASPPPPSGGVGLRVRPVDFDGDGAVDLVIGGRVAGAKWPTSPRSQFLKNNGKGVLYDVTAAVSPDFEKIGMVCDFQFADLDGDNKPELIAVGEWMPVSVFKNEGGKWANRTANFGLENTSGLWNCLLAADLDGDGDTDLAAGNLGLNSRLRASTDAPLQLWASDFDKNGTIDPVVTMFEDGRAYPLPQKALAHTQMPSLKKRFLHSVDWGAASIQEVFDEKQLAAAQKLDAKTLESGWFENTGGKFVFHAFPPEAQISASAALLFSDFTGDGKPDLLMAGNKYGLEVETNRLDAGNGCLLRGDGRGHFSFIENRETGFWAQREVRDMAVLNGPAGRRRVVAANNRSGLQFFEVRN